MKFNPQLVILAGGLGTRLRPLTEHRPKSLVDIHGKPFLQHQIEMWRHQGIRRFVLCVGHRADQIVARFGDGHSLGVEIKYSHDGPSPLGTGGALIQAAPLLEPWFVVLDGDSYLPIDLHPAIARFQARRPLALMTVYRNRNRYGRSNVAVKCGLVTAYDRTQADFGYIHAGLTIFRREALETFASNGFLPMDAIYQRLVANRALACFHLRRRFYEIGSRAGLLDLEEYLSTNRRQAEKAFAAKL